ncbi:MULTISPECIES: glycosyltransferase family 39 protein [unclassified Legionella]|uniref:glycosyltransferase family 39 protein n=1 Tax=unclassified Legionella TaxID=2622702 RepID=UPI0013EF85CD|nr:MULTISPECIES: glycosyltransferase family 39 protein [unclassified Legionella]MDI9817698.1 glycosyltransferase family 39 protein [Legionella sp. PL877]
MAQHLLPGYPGQPPLYTWLQYIFFKFFGVGLLSLALLKCSLILGCLYVFYLICKLHCQNNRLTWCAVLSWVLIPSISLDLIKDNTHSILALLAACLTWYWFVAPHQLSKFFWHLVLGAIIGMGFLTKFNYLLFFIIFLTSVLLIREYRNKLINSYLFLTLFIAIGIASPYILWLLDHHLIGLSSAYKLKPADSGVWQGLVSLIKASLFFAAPAILLTVLFFPLPNPIFRPIKLENKLLLYYHLLSLPLLAFAMIAASFYVFETRWLIPILFLCPALYFSQISYQDKWQTRASFFIKLCLGIQCLLLALLIYISHADRYKSKHILFNQLVQSIKKEQKNPGYIASDSYWLLGNLMATLSFKNAWLVHPQNLSLPADETLLVWQTIQLPFWVKHFSQSYTVEKLKWIKNADNRIVAGYTYAVPVKHQN